jgi:hypothetical protein
VRQGRKSLAGVKRVGGPGFAFETWAFLTNGPNRDTQVSKATPGPPTRMSPRRMGHPSITDAESAKSYSLRSACIGSIAAAR